MVGYDFRDGPEGVGYYRADPKAESRLLLREAAAAGNHCGKLRQELVLLVDDRRWCLFARTFSLQLEDNELGSLCELLLGGLAPFCFWRHVDSSDST